MILVKVLILLAVGIIIYIAAGWFEIHDVESEFNLAELVPVRGLLDSDLALPPELSSDCISFILCSFLLATSLSASIVTS